MDSDPATPIHPTTIFTVPKPDNSMKIVVAALLGAVLVVGLFISWQLTSQKSPKNVPKVPSKTTFVNDQPNTQAVFPTPIPAVVQKKIAYVKDNSIWLVDINGLNKKIIVPNIDKKTEAPPNLINTLGWKNSHVLSYSSCSKLGCSIDNIDTITDSFIHDSFSISSSDFPENQKSLTFAWNHAGNQLAYLYKLFPSEQMRMDFKTSQVKNTVKVFSLPTTGVAGRGVTLDDDVSISFSSDDKYVLVTNTSGQPNNVDTSTIWVFDGNGKELLNIKSTATSWATQAFWLAENTFAYKQGKDLKQYNLKDEEDGMIYSIANFLNPVYNSADKKIYYWVNTPVLPHIESTATSGGSLKTSSKTIDGFYKPQLLPDMLVALKAEKLPTGQEGLFPFASGGLSAVNLADKKTTDLDSGDINLFAISP